MLLFPFSIADIDDPEHIRIVFYSNGRMGHVPLNALLDHVRQNIKSFDEKQTKNTKKTSQRIDVLEQQLKAIIQDLENVKHKSNTEKDSEMANADYGAIDKKESKEENKNQ
ncbi:hypothetical protein [Bartonella sp. CB175]|uniref:hypothetical protein n=1 Tax=Bartonella sp. CB175 TaxID=3112256 RepID=UPI00300DD7DB